MKKLTSMVSHVLMGMNMDWPCGNSCFQSRRDKKLEIIQDHRCHCNNFAIIPGGDKTKVSGREDWQGDPGHHQDLGCCRTWFREEETDGQCYWPEWALL